LPGDERGFRNHGHRVHSSGDYRHLPPEEEHKGLRHYASRIAGDPVEIPEGLRVIVADCVAEKLERINCPTRIVAVTRTHVHALVRCEGDVMRAAGRAKQYASHQVRAALPGNIWGQRSKIVRIKDERHFRWVIRYIADHVNESGAIWEPPDEYRP